MRTQVPTIWKSAALALFFVIFSASPSFAAHRNSPEPVAVVCPAAAQEDPSPWPFLTLLLMVAQFVAIYFNERELKQKGETIKAQAKRLDEMKDAINDKDCRLICLEHDKKERGINLDRQRDLYVAAADEVKTLRQRLRFIMEAIPDADEKAQAHAQQKAEDKKRQRELVEAERLKKDGAAQVQALLTEMKTG